MAITPAGLGPQELGWRQLKQKIAAAFGDLPEKTSAAFRAAGWPDTLEHQVRASTAAFPRLSG